MRKPAPPFPKTLDLVVITQSEARIWHGLPNRDSQHGHPTKPQRVTAPDPHRVHHHVRTGQAHHMHHPDPDDPKYFEAVAAQVGDAQRILVVGHAQGRSNMAKGFIAHMKRSHHVIAERVIGEISADLSALTEPELVDLARIWYAGYVQREG
jgi:hypothetical protein